MDIRPLEFGSVRLSMVKNIDISDAGMDCQFVRLAV